MPFYSSGKGSAGAGVVPVQDQNAKTPTQAGADSGDPIATPDFIIQLQQKLADIRNELSDLMASRYGDACCPPMAGDPKHTVSGIQKEAENALKRNQLENEESAVIEQLNHYMYAGTLGDNGADKDDESY